MKYADIMAKSQKKGQQGDGSEGKPSPVNFLIINNLTNKVTTQAIFEEKISNEITRTFHGVFVSYTLLNRSIKRKVSDFTGTEVNPES